MTAWFPQAPPQPVRDLASVLSELQTLQVGRPRPYHFEEITEPIAPGPLMWLS